MKRFVLACCLLVVVCTLARAEQPRFNHGVDLTDARAVRAMLGGSACKANTPFRTVPNSDPRADGECWEYGTDSNYSLGAVCSFSTSTCIDNCLRSEQTCADNCALTRDPATCSTNGSPCEECQDSCRTQYNSCANSCS